MTKLPSVSHIIRFLSREIYGDEKIDPTILEAARIKGIVVHEACENYIKTGQCIIDDKFKGYLKAFIDFCNDTGFDMKYCEHFLKTDKFLGYVDLIGEMKGKIALIETK